jgi:tellurite resistance protein TerC
MLDVSTLGWALTIGLVVTLLAVDLVGGTLRPHAVGFREATAWSIFYVSVAIAFGVVLTAQAGSTYGTEYFAGFLVEWSLSIDNVFVFVIIMQRFEIPAANQHKVLIIGIVMALILRAIFIAVGATLIELFSFMFLLFGLLLIVTAVQLYRHRNEDPDIEDNALVKFARRALPVTDRYAGGRLIVSESGRRMVTPLFVAIVAIGSVDILFALDSIPAVFGVTEEPYIVFTANAFALLGLRALFFLIKGLLDRLVYLSTGLAVILAFIGVKLVLHWAHDVWAGVPEIETWQSLIVIVGVLAVTTAASLRRAKVDPDARPHAGALRIRGRDRDAER